MFSSVVVDMINGQHGWFVFGTAGTQVAAIVSKHLVPKVAIMSFPEIYPMLSAPVLDASRTFSLAGTGKSFAAPRTQTRLR